MSTAFVFPGQGPEDPAMLVARADSPAFREHYALLCEAAGCDVLHNLERIHDNEVASASTVFVSVLELERLRAKGMNASCAAGYSVGQWSAMFAAGMLSLADTLHLVHKRALLMNASAPTKDGAMLAVIGLPTEKVAQVCSDVVAGGDFVGISNYNCLGQLTLGGTKAGIARAEAALAVEKPRKLARLGTSGAWHCGLLVSARDAFRKELASVAFNEPAFPVADNVTGGWLPKEPEALRDTLAAHLSSPVLWDQCARTLMAFGADELVEVGHGDMLSKFGFFIDRSKRHVPSSKVLS